MTQTESAETLGTAGKFQFWTWVGRLQMIPELFAFPIQVLYKSFTTQNYLNFAIESRK